MNENDSQPPRPPTEAEAARPFGGGFTAVPFGGPMLARPDDPATRAQVNGLEGRVMALEAWRDSQVADDRDEPCETADGPYGRLSAELAEARDDRRTRAEAMLGTAETVKATGGAAEIGGIRMERCDEYGRTETTGRLERVIRERDAADRALNVNRREVSALLEKLEKARAERDEAREGCATHLRWLEDRDGELDQVRAERDAALADAESAEKDLERAEALFSAIKLPADAERPAPTPADPADYGTDNDARHHQERADRLQRDRDEWRSLAHERHQETIRVRRLLVECQTELADARETLARTRAEFDTPRLGCATTDQLIAELYARAKVAGAIGESWPTYRTVDSQ